MSRLRFAVLLLVLLALPTTAQELGEVRLGPAPTPPGWLDSLEQEVLPQTRGGLSVDTQDRSAVSAFFDTHYTPNLSVPIAWTGCSSKTGRNVCPPSAVFHRPPEAAPR